jgi:hypothetical protein
VRVFKKRVCMIILEANSDEEMGKVKGKAIRVTGREGP